jgi:NodT family efflux transporter outer membrane factor (OMF) lipoprotein
MAVTLASGCSLGPKFVRPAAPIHQEWSASTDPHVTESVPDVSWWKTFNDGALDSLVELAYHQNLSLRIAGVRIMESRAQLGLAVGRQYPQVQAAFGSATAVGLSEHAANVIGFDKNFWDYQVGFDASWELDFWGKFRSDVQAQTGAYFANVADYEDALVSLTAEVARTYTVIRTFEVLLDLARTNEALQAEGLRIAQARFKNGATSELDVAQSTTLLESTRATIPQLEGGLVQAQNALCALLGRAPGSLADLLGNSKGIPAPPAQVAISVPAEMLRRRPDIRSAELQAYAQGARIGVAKADFYPRVSIFGTIGTQTASGLSGVSTASLFGPGTFFYSYGPRLFWPLLDWGRTKNNVRIQDARYEELLVNYQNSVLKAAQEAEDGLTGYLKSQEAVVFATSASNAAHRSADLAFKQYREGAVDFQRVLDAQRELLQQESSLARTRSSIATNLIAFYKALGGGWETRQGQPFVPDSTRMEMQKRTNWGNYFSSPPTNSPTSR